ncbi:MAG TPA: hypothetical protein VD929_11730 [Caulobacteraceae bacterium]|nr:hypothetical protein [Caulobacteraceae bacterium]
MLIAAVCAYVLAQLAIGWWASRRTKGEADYFVAGRRLGLFAVSMSLFATWFGSETVMASSAAVASEGLSGARAEPFGYFLALLLMGVFVAARMRAAGHMTLGDFFRARFGPQAESWCVLANVITSVTWAAAQMAGLSVVVSALTDLPPQTTLAFAALCVVVYTSMGGLAGDVATDVLQGMVLLAGLVVLLAAVVARAGGPAEAAALIDPAKLALIAPGESWLARLDAWAVPVLGSLVASEAIARFLGARDARVARSGAFVASALYLVAGLIPVLIGLMGAGLGLKLGTGDLFLPGLAEQLLPPVLLAVFTGALLSAILSTVDSNILSVSSLLTRNGFDRVRPNASERTKLAVARAATVLAGLAAWAIAATGESIYQLIEWTSAFGTSGVLVSFLIGAYAGFGSGRAAVASILAGFACNAVTILLPALQGRDEADGAFLLSIVVSLGAYVAAAALDRSPRPRPA